MSDPIKISARHLGMIALPYFCERCFWVRSRLNWKVPWMTFPSIFSKLDAAQKNHIHQYINAHGSVPPWLSSLGKVTQYIDPPHFGKFFIIDETSNMLVRGTADGILIRNDSSVVIIDYKTASPRGSKDPLAGEYQVQLNVYALAAERLGIAPVTDLALVYLEPLTDAETMSDPTYAFDWGFAVPYRASIHPVDLDPTIIPPLCKIARQIIDQPTPPSGRSNCKDCEKLEELLAVAGKDPCKATASMASDAMIGFLSQTFPSR